jgi:putative SOS response-associated peptidase YedK
MADIHNRMPVILADKDYDRWLDAKKPGADVADLLKAFPAKQMEAFPVSTRVNAPKNQGPELIAEAR